MQLRRQIVHNLIVLIGYVYYTNGNSVRVNCNAV